ncbi:hypothetical protein HHL25_05420 [Rhizobium sp. S-51]|uniref:Tape measure protein N-terminal domain-containing protein n=1 Tax=Rhizobium terricola TaxID=2728849 RepID=A0A7Y0AUA5_9HYPH|nr:tape measure protein [Rhizobium terricola]NML73564.1 hypothetical protein [Rhizobium terricola]
MSIVVEELIAQLGWDLTGEEDLRKFKKGMSDAEKGLSALATRMATFAAAAATAFGGGMAMLGKSVIGVSADFEGFQASLETIEGSATKAKASMDWITQFAAKTPYELAGVTDAFIKLKSYGIDPMDDTLRILGDTASAMNKPLNMAVEAFADATSFQFERLREFGLVASQKGDQVTFQWTKNGQTLTKTVKKSGAEIQKFLKDHFGSTFNGAMLRQSKTWNGMMSNLSDGWNIFQKKIGDKGFFDRVKGYLGGLLDYLGELDANGTLDRWATSLSNGLTWAVDTAVYSLSRLRRHFEFLTGWMTANPTLFNAIKAGLAAIAAVKFPWIAGLLIFEDILSWFEGGDSTIRQFAEALSKLTGIDADKLDEIIATLAAATALGAAATAIGAFSASIWPLTVALAALGGAYYLAKGALDFFAAQEAKISGIKAVDNPKAKPGYVEGAGYDENGKFIYMDGNRRVDGPKVNPQAGFTQDALDYKTMMENLEGNRIKMEGRNAAAKVESNLTDNRNQSVKVEVGGVVVNGVAAATSAVGAAVGSAVGNAAAGSGRASRFEKDDAF